MAVAKVRVGSLILLSSVSHLAAVGTAAYTESFVRAAKHIGQCMMGKVAVRVGVPILLGGVEGSSLVRSLHEVAAWADSMPIMADQFPKLARQAFLLALKNNGVGTTVHVDSFTLQLPVGLATFEKKTLVSSGWDNIHQKISAFSADDEKQIIDSLVSEIQTKLAISIPKEICYDRLAMASAIDGNAQESVVLVGASHARKLGLSLEALDLCVKIVETPSWKPNSLIVSTALAQLEEVLKSTPRVIAVIFTCLDGAAFYAMTEDSVIPISRDSGGVYHVYGQLVGAPHDMFSSSVKTCLPLFSCMPAVRKLILSPLPRYWQHRCCSDDEHVSNLGDADFDDMIFSCLDAQRRIIKDVLHTSGVKSFTVLNFGQLCTSEAGSKTTSDDTKNALAVMWGADPVHPSEDAYTTAAVHISSILQPAAATACGGGPAPAPERPAKRPRWLQEESSNTVVPRGGLTRGWNPRRGRGLPRGRGWRGRGGRGGGR
jgi:hypothetical protein